MKKFNINTIMNNGIKNAPCVGISGAFYKYQFCDTHENGMLLLIRQQKEEPNIGNGFQKEIVPPLEIASPKKEVIMFTST